MRIEVTGADQLRRVTRELKGSANPRAMRREMTRELRLAVRPAVLAARQAARSLPAEHSSVQQRDRRGRFASGFHSGHNLRRQMARSINTQVRTGGRSAGVKVRMSKRTLGELWPAARMLDRSSWRHPVFGSDRWVPQDGVLGWFERANRAQASSVRAGLKRVLDRLERRLVRGF